MQLRQEEVAEGEVGGRVVRRDGEGAREQGLSICSVAGDQLLLRLRGQGTRVVGGGGLCRGDEPAKGGQDERGEGGGDAGHAESKSKRQERWLALLPSVLRVRLRTRVRTGYVR